MNRAMVYDKHLGYYIEVRERERGHTIPLSS